MTQQLSPWLETAYGWNYGESGWNSGMDSNLLKFSVMFDRNVDSIVSSLPAAVNGQVHYNTSDNRLYFAVNTTYFSTPVPKWYTIVLRSTGATWQFNGTILSQVDSIVNIDLRLDALELTTSTLGTAAFEDVGHFATQAELDVVEAQSQEYTDDLRADLSNPSTGGSFVSWSGSTVGEWIDQHEGRLDALDLANSYVRPQDFDPLAGNGDGRDDTAAVLAAVSDGRPVYWGDTARNYRITSGLSITLARNMLWASSGATVTMDSATQTARMVNITANSKDIHISGPLTFNANRKAFGGVYCDNSVATTPSFTAIDLKVTDCYRPDTSTSDGDGIRIRGGYSHVNLVRPDVRRVTMAAGAGVFGSVGVSGITVSRALSPDNVYPLEVSIVDPHIESIYSEDIAYTADQDGIRVFSYYTAAGVATSKGHFTIRGGRFIDCGGRSIKAQMENGSVSGCMFVREGTPVRREGYPEIDFQVGGGSVTDITCWYRFNAVPSTVVNFSGHPTAGRLSQGGTVRGAVVMVTGGAGLRRFASIAHTEQAQMFTRISDVEIRIDTAATTAMDYFVTTYASSAAFQSIIYLRNIVAPVLETSAFVWRVGTVFPVVAQAENMSTGRNFTTPAFGATTPGSMTTQLAGLNVNVS